MHINVKEEVASDFILPKAMAIRDTTGNNFLKEKEWWYKTDLTPRRKGML